MPFVLEAGVCQQTDLSPHQKEREEGRCLSCQQTNVPLEGVRVATDATTQSKLLSRGWVLHVQRTLIAFHLTSTWPCSTETGQQTVINRIPVTWTQRNCQCHSHKQTVGNMNTVINTNRNRLWHIMNRQQTVSDMINNGKQMVSDMIMHSLLMTRS